MDIKYASFLLETIDYRKILRYTTCNFDPERVIWPLRRVFFEVSDPERVTWPLRSFFRGFLNDFGIHKEENGLSM